MKNSSDVPSLAIKMRPEIERLAKRMGIREADRVFQEVCIACWRRADLLAQCRNPDRWILAVARNAANAVRRQNQWRCVELPDDFDGSKCVSGLLPSAEDQVERAEVCCAVRTAVDHLPQKYREVIDAYYFENESLDSFACRKGHPLETCRTRRKRACHLLESEDSLQEFRDIVTYSVEEKARP